MSKTNSINLLYYENIIKIQLEDNKLYVIFLGESLNDKIFLKMLEKMELFFNICQKKNTKFYGIYDFSKYKTINFPSLYSYIKKGILFLNKHRDFFKTNLYGTIFLTESTMARNISELVLNQYTPIRPYKFLTTKEEILFDFTFDN